MLQLSAAAGNVMVMTKWEFIVIIVGPVTFEVGITAYKSGLLPEQFLKVLN